MKLPPTFDEEEEDNFDEDISEYHPEIDVASFIYLLTTLY